MAILIVLQLLSILLSHQTTDAQLNLGCIYSPWSALSPCDVSCGNGTIVQTRTIIQLPLLGVCVEPLSQLLPCVTGILCDLILGPSLLSSVVSNDGLSILLTFDQPTNQETDCNEIFLPATMDKLGENPICTWPVQNNGTLLQVFFGVGPTLLINEFIYFNRLYSSTTSALIRTLFALLLPPLNPDQTINRIIGPPAIHRCGMETYDGSTSGPTLGRPLNFSWNFMDGAITSLDPLFTIPANNLIPGVYNFTLAVTNWIGVQTLLTYVFQILFYPGILPDIPFPNRLMTQSGNLLAKALMLPLDPSCLPSPLNESDSPIYYTYQWRLLANDTISNETKVVKIVANSPSLFVPKFNLPVGFSELEVLISVVGYPFINGTKKIFVEMTPPPMDFILTGGNRLISIEDSSAIKLNLSYPLDGASDVIGGALVPVQNLLSAILWECNVVGDLTNSIPCLTTSLVDFVNETQFAILPSQVNKLLPIGSVLNVTAKVVNDAFQAATSSLLVVTNTASLPVIYIAPVFLGDFFPINLPLNMHSIIDLATLLSPGFNLTAITWQWSCSICNGLALSEDVLSTSLVGDSIQLLPNTLVAGKTYVFTVKATILGITTSANVTVTTLVPPSGGICSIFPLSGIAFETPFELICSGWTDFYNSSLIYGYYLLPECTTPHGTTSLDAVLVSGFQLLSNISVLLPPGNQTIRAVVKNVLGATVDFLLNVNILPSLSNDLFNVTQSLIQNFLIPSSYSLDLDPFTQGITLITQLFICTPLNGIADLMYRKQTRADLINRITNFTTGLIAYNAPKVYPDDFRLYQCIVRVLGIPTEIDSTYRLNALNLLQDKIDQLYAYQPNDPNGDEFMLYSTLIDSFSNVDESINSNLNLYSDQTELLTLQQEAKQYADSFQRMTNQASLLMLKGAYSGVSIQYQNWNYSISAFRMQISDGIGEIVSQEYQAGLYQNLKLPFGLYDTTVVTSPDLYSRTLPLTGSNSDSIRSPNSISVTYRDNLGQVLDQLGSFPSIDSLDFNPIKDGYINFSISHPDLTTLSNPQMERFCQYWDEKIQDWSSDGCLVDVRVSNSTLTFCICSHTTTYSVKSSNFVPIVNTLTVEDLSELNSANIRRNPATLIAVFVFAAFFLLLLPFAIYRDRRDKNEEAVKNFLKSLDHAKHLEVTYKRAVLKGLRTKPDWWAPFLRRFGDNYSSVRRLNVLVTSFYLTSVIGATFYNQRHEEAVIVVTIASGGITFLIINFLHYIFTYSGDHGVRRALQIKMQASVPKSRNSLKLDFDRWWHPPMVSIIDDDLVLREEKRHPSWCIYFGDILCFMIIGVSIWLMLVYGIVFDTTRPTNSQDVTWWETPGTLINGQTLRFSYDTIPVCQLSCMTQLGCDGIVTRSIDQACFEMNGRVTSAAEYAGSYFTLQFKDLRTSITVKWLYSLALGIGLGFVLSLVKAFILVTIVWLIVGKALRKTAKRKSLVVRGTLQISTNKDEVMMDDLVVYHTPPLSPKDKAQRKKGGEEEGSEHSEHSEKISPHHQDDDLETPQSLLTKSVTDIENPLGPMISPPSISSRVPPPSLSAFMSPPTSPISPQEGQQPQQPPPQQLPNSNVVIDPSIATTEIEPDPEDEYGGF